MWFTLKPYKGEITGPYWLRNLCTPDGIVLVCANF